MKKVTMEDVAREAGCSRAQVSRMLSGKSYVAEELRMRIQAALKRMNYRNRANRHRIRLAIIVKEAIGLFLYRLLDALMKDILRRKWECCIIPEQNKTLVSERFYDGAVCSVYAREWARKWAEERGMPLVMLNSYGTTFDNICTIDPDTYDESRRVLEHLKSLGHRRIARIHFCAEKKLPRGGDAFLEAASDLNLAEVRNFSINETKVCLKDTIRPILEQGFTALFMIHQHLAVRAAKTIQDAGFRIPEDVSLITYENPGISEYLTPPHTTLDFDYSAIAKRALDELRLRILGKEGTGGVIPVPNKLIVRGSTGPARRESGFPPARG